MYEFTHFVFEDPTEGQIACGLGDGTRNIAMEIRNLYGIGIHQNEKLNDQGIKVAFVLDVCPIAYSKCASYQSIQGRMFQLLKNEIRPNISLLLGNKLQNLWEDIVKITFSIYEKYSIEKGLGIQITLVLVVYHKLQTRLYNGTDFVDLEPNQQTNLYCWYNFVTSIPAFGGVYV